MVGHAPGRRPPKSAQHTEQPTSGERQTLPSTARGTDEQLLPEGEEPRTIQAAAQCVARGIAKCVLLGAPDERAKCEAVARGARHGAIVAAGETGVGELVAMLSLSQGFAGNDSGCMHVAGALGIPTVAVFGSTNPAHTGPMGPRTRVIYRGLECSPCLARTCRFGHYNCLTLTEPEEVAESLKSLGAVG